MPIKQQDTSGIGLLQLDTTRESHVILSCPRQRSPEKPVQASRPLSAAGECRCVGRRAAGQPMGQPGRRAHPYPHPYWNPYGTCFLLTYQVPVPIGSDSTVPEPYKYSSYLAVRCRGMPRVAAAAFEL